MGVGGWVLSHSFGFFEAVRHYFYLLYYSDSLSELPFHHATSIQLEGEGNVCGVLAEASVW